MHTQDIYNIIYYDLYCALFAHVLCMHDMDLVIMPKRLVLIATYTCGESEWMVGL